MTCDELAAAMTDFLDGVLPAPMEAEALEHLASCPRCETVLAETREVIALGGRFGRAQLDADERADLFDRIVRDVSGNG